MKNALLEKIKSESNNPELIKYAEKKISQQYEYKIYNDTKEKTQINL